MSFCVGALLVLSAGEDEMEADGDAIPAAPEDLMQMNEPQARGVCVSVLSSLPDNRGDVKALRIM